MLFLFFSVLTWKTNPLQIIMKSGLYKCSWKNERELLSQKHLVCSQGVQWWIQMEILGLVNLNLAPNIQATGLPDSMFASVLPCWRDFIHQQINTHEAKNSKSCNLKANCLEIRAQMQNAKVQERGYISQCVVDNGSFYFFGSDSNFQEITRVVLCPTMTLHTEAMQNTLLSRYT